ncbi:Holliday junction branch migration protein RuvA [Gryllotalpicola protaetiae]|uniref:Holliday junction branch migration complex subunit RuvA n=1 Tax=Gryllotalpicola protaetiae TaxID=2419771 RepID=A0A387BSB3_9MICO|nr:Holliday junction branch migration protein RuvA [Gryllotalpicola protaetiae]AYG04964.1 Holliday junction branch migration protein RuvA [Gryllotalpicola protaetiae]
MISSLRGTVLRASGAELVIEVAGVGYLVSVTPEHALALRVGDEALVHTALIVREDALSLFGFEDVERLDVFQLLLGVNGVGPKSALGVLSALTPDQIARAVQSDDDAVFRKVSGIGPKTAKLIVVQLAGKLHVVAPAAAAPAAKQKTTVGDDVRVALVGLGWPEKVAADAVAEVLAELGDAAADATAASVPALLRRALAVLGPAAQHQPAGAGR